LPGYRCASTILSKRYRGRPVAREQRRLAAVMAVDLVGYSRLMGREWICWRTI
jgi:class 3 adenylate cyclase